MHNNNTASACSLPSQLFPVLELSSASAAAMSTTSQTSIKQSFFAQPHSAVVGASKAEQKWGTKVRLLSFLPTLLLTIGLQVLK
jgi:hypothetical protein